MGILCSTCAISFRATFFRNVTLASNETCLYQELAPKIKKQWQLGKIVVNPLALSVPTVILDTLQQSHTKLSLSPRIMFRVQKAVILNTCFIIRIIPE